ncbi:MAG: hypothetical protein ABSE47_16385, partial [Acidimicrobiales bacterium]
MTDAGGVPTGAVGEARYVPLETLEDPATHPPEEAAPNSGYGPAPITKPAGPRGRRRILEWVAVVLLAVLAAAGLRTFVVQAF